MTIKTYRKIQRVQARPYVPGEDLAGITPGPNPPKDGDFVVWNAGNERDRWLVAEDVFLTSYEEV